MRAQPATSEERRPAAQLVAYGGSRTGSMREGAHPGRIAAYPAENQSHEATRTRRRPLRDVVTKVGRKSPQTNTREPIIQEPASHQQETGPDAESQATRRDADVTESSRANRGWWDRNADEYQVEHGTFLGDDRFVWGPEGLDEVEAELLGPPEDLKGRDVLEIGSRRRPVRALAGGAGSPPGRPRHLPPPAPARPAHRYVLPPGVRRRGRAALRGRLVRPGVLGVRRSAVRRRPGTGPQGGAARPAPGRPLRLLCHPPHPLGIPRRARPRGALRLRLLLRPHALRRTGRGGPRGVRRAPPHDRRPGA